MTSFASKLINALFKRASARPATARRAALGFEPLDIRAVLSTVLPATVADDVVVDGQILTGENFDSSRSEDGQVAGKIPMQDSHFNRSAAATGRHTGGVNVLFADGSVRFVSDSIVGPTINAGSGGTAGGTGTGGGGGGTGKVSMQDFHFSHPTGALRNLAGGAQAALGDGSVRFVRDSIAGPVWNAASDGAAAAAGTGKVSMQDFWFRPPGVAGEPADELVVVGAGAQPHVKVIDGTRLGAVAPNGGVSVATSFPYGGFLGGVTVSADDVNDSAGFESVIDILANDR